MITIASLISTVTSLSLSKSDKIRNFFGSAKRIIAGEFEIVVNARQASPILLALRFFHSLRLDSTVLTCMFKKCESNSLLKRKGDCIFLMIASSESFSGLAEIL